MSEPGVLSTIDVLEIKKFALGRSRIKDLTETSNTWPEIDPFGDFIGIELSSDGSPANSTNSSNAIKDAWKDLEDKLQQVNAWQDERDAIEAEAARFEVGDMERLRQVAKAASERELSSHDTDLIELTVQTLVSLDILLRLLRTRRENLDVYQARLQWEERRRDCYSSYASLSADIDDFVKQARWSPLIYQKSSDQGRIANVAVDDSLLQQIANIANCSPETSRSTPNAGLMSSSAAKRRAALVKSHSTALSYRCRSFVTEIVPAAAIQLDEIISLRKVPDAFLDEQDRIEDLAENIRSQDVFLIQLSLQWRKADEIFRTLRSLHADGKKLHVAISTAHREATTRDRLLEFDKQTEVLKRRLEGLCGTQAVEHYFNLKDYTISSDRLSTAIESSIPVPTCEQWKDQEIHNKEVKEALDKEMCTAAKYARSACQAAARYKKAVSSFDDLQICISATADLSDEYVTLQEDIQRILLEKEGDLGRVRTGGKGDSTCPTILCHKENIQVDQLDLCMKQTATFENHLLHLEERIPDQLEVLQRGLTACIKSAVPLHTFRNGAEGAQQDLEVRRRSCNDAMTELRSVAALAQETQDLLSRLDLLQSNTEELLEKVKAEASRLQCASLDEAIIDTTTQDLLRSQLRAGKEDLQSLEEPVKEAIKKLKLRGAIELHDKLAFEIVKQNDRERSLQEALDWLDSVYKQRCHLSTLQERYMQLMADATAQERKLEKGADSRLPQICLPEEAEQAVQNKSAMDCICIAAIDDYITTAHKKAILVGDEPAMISTQVVGSEARSSMDAVMRSQVNDWCSLLSSAAQDIEQAQIRKQDSRMKMQIVQERFSASIHQWEKLCTGNKSIIKDMSQQIIADEHIDCSSLLDSLKLQRSSLHELLEIKESYALSAAASLQCQQYQAEMEDLEKQYESLLQSRSIQRANDLSSTARRGSPIMDHEETESGHQKAVNGLQESEQICEMQRPRVETLLEEPRRRGNGSRKSKSHQALENRIELDGDPPLPVPSQEVSATIGLPENDIKSSDKVPSDHIDITTDDIQIKLRNTVKELAKHCTGGPIDEQTSASGRKQLQNGLMLPTIEKAGAIKRRWAEVKVQVEEVIQECQSKNMIEEAERLRTMMQVRDAKMRRFTHLATFASQQQVIEGLLSSLLDSLDGHTESNSVEAMQLHLDEIDASLKEIELIAEPILTDVRVRHQLGQLRHSYQDMAEMARERSTKPLLESSRDAILPSRASTNSSLPSLCGSVSEEEEELHGETLDRTLSMTTLESTGRLSQPYGTPRMLSSKSSSIPSLRNRAYSNASTSSISGIPLAISRNTPQMSYDRRSVSESTAMATPSRMPISMSRSEKRLPVTPALTPRHTNSTNTTSGSSQFKTPQRRLHTPGRPSTAQSHYDLTWRLASTKSPSAEPRFDQTPKPNSSPLKSTMVKNGKPNQYRANPKSKLDVAVAKIVNKMPMQVNITHATVRDTKAKEQWHDESGRYWVGHPDPKLCFCRILRSRTVMVRIGGGWQELSTYIVKHYSHLAPDASLSVATSPHVSPQIERNKLDELHWADSSTLLATPVTARKTSDSRFTSAKNSPDSTHLTPLTNIDWKRDSPRGVVPLGKNTMMIMSDPAVRAASPSPNIPQQPRFEVEKAGLWIRQERRTSQVGASSAPNSSFDSVLKSDKDSGNGGVDATKSTITSRNRRLSHITPSNWPPEKVNPVSRIISKTRRDASISASSHNRVTSTASSKRAPRSSLYEN